MSTDVDFEKSLSEGLGRLCTSAEPSRDALASIIKQAQSAPEAPAPPNPVFGPRLLVAVGVIALVLVGAAVTLGNNPDQGIQHAGVVPDFSDPEIEGCGGGFSTPVDPSEVPELRVSPPKEWVLVDERASRDESREVEGCQFGLLILASRNGMVVDRVVTVRVVAGPSYDAATSICGTPAEDESVRCFELSSGELAVSFDSVVSWEIAPGVTATVWGSGLTDDDLVTVVEAVELMPSGNIAADDVPAIAGFEVVSSEPFGPTMGADSMSWRADYRSGGREMLITVSDPASSRSIWADMGGLFEELEVNGVPAVGFFQEDAALSTLIWDADGQRLSIRSDLSLDELVAIAESL